jgi:non-specific serine/threonine protein kinase/serine/threonine-protein kinase
MPDSERQRRLEELHSGALKLDAGERDEFLRRGCCGDAELRQAVESLLGYEQKLDGFLEAPPLQTQTLDAAADPEQSKTGQTLGPYRLLQPIGSGGMGEVWLAEQKQPVRRRVAIKLIKAGMDTREVVARFQSERQALALMEHPNIAKVFDAGATPQGRPYFVMEYVTGLPITEYCDQHRMTLRERLELFIHVCEGVQHAHQRAIIHRDLKPTNILVGEVDGRPVPRIIDFGLAKATAQELAAETLFTQAGAVMGTPGYMSPEQADSIGVNVDTRTDVYSLGVVLYELLVGAVPLDFHKLAFGEIIRKLREEEAAPPSKKLRTLGEQSGTTAKNRGTDPPALARQLRGDLDAIALKALEKERSRRYATPAELAADIGRYLFHKPVLARPASAAYRARKYIRRHWVAGAAAGGLLVVLVSFGIAQTLQLRRTTRERDRADRIAAFMTGMFKVSNPSAARGNSITAREILDKASKEIDRELSKDPELQAQMMSTMGMVYQSLGLYSQAQPLLTRAMVIRNRALGPRNPATLTSQSNLGWNLICQGRLTEAEKLLRETMYIQRRVLGPEHTNTLDSMVMLALALQDIGRYAEAEKLDRETLDVRRRVLGPEHPDTLSSMNALANVFGNSARYAEAEKLHRQVLDIRRRVLGRDHPDTLSSMNNLGVALYRDGRSAEAMELFRETLDIERRISGPEHPHTLMSMNNLANMLREAGRFADAEKLQREALESQRRVLGPEHPQTAISTYNLACIFADKGNRNQALTLLREAVDHGLDPMSDLAIEKDPDFKSLHGDPRFAALVAHAKERAAAAQKPK